MLGRYAALKAATCSTTYTAPPKKCRATRVISTLQEIQNISNSSFHVMAVPQLPRSVPVGPCEPTEDGSERYALDAGAAGFSGFGALSPIMRTLLSSSDICMPESASKSAGTCAAIFVMSPVSL
jgi:hypothetical protein